MDSKEQAVASKPPEKGGGDPNTPCVNVSGFISDVHWGYQRSPISLFRRYQDSFLQRYGRELTGRVVEVGGEKHYHHERFFPRASSYVCTNIARDYDEYLDLTHIQYANDSQDAYVCCSVLAHVYELERALSEIHRTLKRGGKLLLSAPFAFPVCDDFDYWRFSRDFYTAKFREYDVLALVQLGGRISTIAEVLQRPKGKRRSRYAIYKMIGVVFAGLLGRFDTPDSFPLGYGFYARKR